MGQAGAGRYVLSGVAALTSVTGFLADWNHTHLFNPTWPPHAKFHDAWTILLGASLGSIALHLLWKEEPDFELGAILPGLFWAAQAGSFALPGARGIASEFPDPASRAGLARVHESVSSTLMLGLTGLGYALARKHRLSRA